MSVDLNQLDLTNPPELEEKEEVVKEEAEEKEKTLADYLAEYPGSPDAGQLEKWKQQHGDVLCSCLSETELYVFRPITRAEFVNLQSVLATMQEKPNNFEIEVKIVETCVLWASPQGQESLEKKAGTFSTLHEQILQMSNFVNPAYASQFVIKL